MKNDSAEVGFVLCLFISLQGALHMVVQSDGVVEDGEDFCVIVMIMGKHFVDILLHPRNFSPIMGEIVLHDGKRLLQVGFFGLPRSGCVRLGWFCAHV